VIESEKKLLKRIRYLMLLAMVLLVVAEVSYLLINSAKYVFTIIITLIFAGLQWIYWHKKGSSSLRKVMVLSVLLLTLLSPILFFLFQWLVMGLPFVGLELLVPLSFILPIILMLYIDKQLLSLLNN